MSQPFETCVRCGGGIDLGRAAMHVCGDASFPPEDDFYASEVERRFQRELELGQMDGDHFITRSGARVPAFVSAPDDDEYVDAPCVYCQGNGDIPSDNPFSYESFGCQACSGTGVAGRVLRGTQRKEQWLDMLFFTDAPRFEMMDRDICPDCGGGGCGGECHWTPEEWAKYAGEPIEQPFGSVEGDSSATITPEVIDQWAAQMERSIEEVAERISQ